MADDRIDRLERELARMRKELQQERQKGDAGLSWVPLPDEEPPRPQPGRGQPSKAGRPAPPVQRRSEDLESQFGGRVLAIIGGVVFVIGIVFFLSLAFDRGWIPPAARIVMGIVGGLAIWGLGIFLDRGRDMRIYGQILSAVGAITAYVTLWLAYQLESFREITGLNLETDAVLLGIFAVAVAGDAMWRRAQALAAMALGLVFTTAMISHAWAPFSVFYAVTMVILIVLVAAYRQWPGVTFGAVPAGFGVLFVHLGLDVSPGVVLAGAGVLLAAFLVAGMFRMRGELPWELQTAAQALALLAAWGLSMWALYDLDVDPTKGHGPVTGILAVVSLALGAIPVFPRESRIGWVAAGAVFALAWPPIQFDGILVGYGWAGLALAMAITAAATRSPVFQWVATGVGGVLLVRLLTIETAALHQGDSSPVAGLGLFALAFAAYLLGWLAPILSDGREIALGRAMLAGAAITPLLYTAAVLDGAIITIAWAATFVVFLGLGFATGHRDLRVAGLVLVFPVLIRLLFIDMAGVDVVLRVVAFLVVGAILLVAAFFYARSTRQSSPPRQAPPRRPADGQGAQAPRQGEGARAGTQAPRQGDGARTGSRNQQPRPSQGEARRGRR